MWAGVGGWLSEEGIEGAKKGWREGRLEESEGAGRIGDCVSGVFGGGGGRDALEGGGGGTPPTFQGAHVCVYVCVYVYVCMCVWRATYQLRCVTGVLHP